MTAAIVAGRLAAGMPGDSARHAGMLLRWQPALSDIPGRRLRRARPGQLRVVVVHHPLDVADAADEADIVRGAREAVGAWALAGVDLVLSGHVHAPLCRPLAGRYGPAARGCWAVLAGSALSTRLRGGHPNSVNLIRYAEVDGERRCRVERHDYDEERAEFRLAGAQVVVLGG